MLRKIRNIMLLAWVFMFVSVRPVAAIDPITPVDLTERLRHLVMGVIQPLGAFVIFLAICFAGFKLILTANKPQERAEVLASLPYIVGGGILLGSVMLLSGFIIGLMEAI